MPTDRKTFKFECEHYSRSGMTIKTYVVTGTERNIIRHMLCEISYGYDRYYKSTIDEFISDLKRGNITEWDGCGGFHKIWNEAGDLIYYYQEESPAIIVVDADAECEDIPDIDDED